jgi:predicted thioesterase
MKSSMVFNTTEADLAAAFGNAGVRVVGTPALIGFLETAAAKCVAELLQPGDASVGTAINVQHLAAAPAFARIQAMAELVARENNRVSFSVQLRWGEIVVMRGSHERRIVNLARFMARLEGAG